MFSNAKETRKSSYKVNGALTFLVYAMMILYYVIGADILFYYSIFVGAVYLLNFFLISKNQFRITTWTTYAMLTLYMFICTICLGYNYGFQLYSMSTIPLIYYMKYIGIQINAKDPKPLLWSILIVISCITSSLYSVQNGPIYTIEGIAPSLFLAINTLAVCLFLIIFSQNMIFTVIKTEGKLTHQADHDALTGLANRYYMTTYLEHATLSANADQLWIAMLDIDNFKKINDKYGHISGDRVLIALSNLMKNMCYDCTTARWGGEEFLICGKDRSKALEIMQCLRENVERLIIKKRHEVIQFSISAGVAHYIPGQCIDDWVIEADRKLYIAKENGKNQIIA